MFDPSAPHIIILLIVVLLLFGSRRLPGAARSLGESMHIFKKSVQGINPDEETAANPPASAAATQFPPYAPVVAQPAVVAAAQPAVAAAPDATAQQLADLQRQLTELQRQQAAGNGAVTSAQAEQAPTAQPF